MFTEIRLTNFKSYRKPTAIPLAPLTVIIGMNNAGKSSVLQAILLLKQTLDDRGSNAALITQGQIDVGGFLDIVHKPPKGGPEPQQQEFGIGASRRPLNQIPNFGGKRPVRASTDLDITFGFHAKSNEIVVNRSALSSKGTINLEVIKGRWSSTYVEQKFADEIKLPLKHFLPAMSGPFPMNPKDRQDVYYALVALIEFDAQTWYSLFDNLHNIPPTRSRIPFFSAASRRASSDFGPGGENLLMALASSEKVERSKTLCELVGEWLTKQFKIISNLRVKKYGPQESIYALLADDPNGRQEINVAGMGEGVSQMLPILARVLSVPKDACLLIEQPELHLHPAAQADMADLFIDRAKDGRQVVIETHSEHILLRIRRRIAQGIIDPKEVSVVFIEKDGGESTARRLDLNDSGQFDKWPKGFFGDAYNEAMALAMAEKQK